MQYQIEQLLKLAANPFYKMNDEQLKQLEDYNAQVTHDSTIPKHDTSVRKHDTKPKKDKPWKKN